MIKGISISLIYSILSENNLPFIIDTDFNLPLFYTYDLFQVLAESGFTEKLAQMPVVLIPVHFDRDPVTRLPSCQRSLVLRPFITHDFMTGIPALPGKHIIPEVRHILTFPYWK